MYDSERLMKAIGDINDRKIEETGRMLGYIKEEKRKGFIHMSGKKIVMIAAVVVMVLALGVTAYAQVFGGIGELWPKTNVERPEFPTQAAELIESQDKSAEGENWTCRIVETYCDDANLIITARVTCNEKYIVVPTDAMEDELAANYGFDGQGTLGEYAAEKGKTLLLMNMGMNDEKIGWSSASLYFENVSENELLMMYNANKNTAFDSIDTSCQIIALEYGKNEPERVNVPLTLTAGKTEMLGEYVPVDPDAVPGIHVGEAVLTRTPLGLCIQYPEEITDEEAQRGIMTFRCEEIDFRGQGALGFTAEDGTEYSRLTMGEGEASDTLTIHYLDWDKQVIADIVFEKK